MALRHRKDDLIALRERKARAAALETAVPLIFRKLAENGEISKVDIAAHSVLLEFWTEDGQHQEGCIRRCPEDGEAYQCIRTPNPAARSSMAPPSMAKENWEAVAKD